MKVNIDFSIFLPHESFGYVTGTIELASPPKIGDMVHLFRDEVTQSTLEFSGHLRVTSISVDPMFGPIDVLIGLEDVLPSSKEEAIRLVNKLETEYGLFWFG